MSRTPLGGSLCSFLSGSFGGSLFGDGLSSLLGGLRGGSSLRSLLGQSLGASLVDLGLLSLGSLLGLDRSILDAAHLSLDFGVTLSLPVVPLLVSSLLGQGTLGDTAVEVVAKENALVGEDATSGEGRFGTHLQPSQGALSVENDRGRVGVGVVGADLLDVTTIARGARIRHYNVEECEILLTVAL